MIWPLSLLSRRSRPARYGGQRVHAYQWTEFGRAEVVGLCRSFGSADDSVCVIRLDDGDLVAVWSHDVRPVGEPLPAYGPELGT